MIVFPASSISGGVAFVSRSINADFSATQNTTANFPCTTTNIPSPNSPTRRPPPLTTASKVSVSNGGSSRTLSGSDRSASSSDDERQLRLSPSHSCKDPDKKIQEVAQSLVDTTLSVKVIQADEENRKLIFSEKESSWLKFSPQLKYGDIFVGRVGSVEDYGAFVHLRFPDGLYYITGFVHVSEVSWDLVQDVRDVLIVGDQVRVKVINIDREKSRVTLSMKQLEEDPLLETLDRVIPKDYTLDLNASDSGHLATIEPLPGLNTIIQELLKEDGIHDVRISRQGFEKRVVSQDLQLWLSNAPPVGNQYTLLARAGRQVQEIQVVTSLDQEGIKTALQNVLERVP